MKVLDVLRESLNPAARGARSVPHENCIGASAAAFDEAIEDATQAVQAAQEAVR